MIDAPSLIQETRPMNTAKILSSMKEHWFRAMPFLLIVAGLAFASLQWPLSAFLLWIAQCSLTVAIGLRDWRESSFAWEDRKHGVARVCDLTEINRLLNRIGCWGAFAWVCCSATAGTLSTNWAGSKPLKPAPPILNSTHDRLVSKARPALAAPAPRPAFFAVTAYNLSGIESDMSKQLSFSFPPGINSYTFDWTDADPTVTGYRVYWGTNGTDLLWQTDVGKTLVYTVPQVFPVAPLVPVYYTVYGQSSTNPIGPFTDFPSPIARVTNSQGLPRSYYRLRVFSSTNALDTGTLP